MAGSKGKPYKEVWDEALNSRINSRTNVPSSAADIEIIEAIICFLSHFEKIFLDMASRIPDPGTKEENTWILKVKDMLDEFQTQYSVVMREMSHWHGKDWKTRWLALDGLRNSENLKSAWASARALKRTFNLRRPMNLVDDETMFKLHVALDRLGIELSGFVSTLKTDVTMLKGNM